MRTMLLGLALAAPALLLGGCASANMSGGSFLPSASQALHVPLDSVGGSIPSVRAPIPVRSQDSVGGSIPSLRVRHHQDSVGGSIPSLRVVHHLDSVGGSIPSHHH
jgi:hypothetical protein